MNFLYYLAAIGESNFDKKIEILTHNLKYLYDNIKQNFDIIVNLYEINNIYENRLKDEINKLEFIDNIFIHKKKGILVQLWFSNPYHNIIDNYDYILFILDDVKIDRVDINHMIRIKEENSIEFFSPRVTGSTHSFMNKYNNGLYFSNSVEIYFFLLNKNDFHKFMQINSIDNYQFWGVDLLFGYFNIKSAIYYDYNIIHVLPSQNNRNTAIKNMIKYLNKFGFKSHEEVIKKYGNIKEVKSINKSHNSICNTKKRIIVKQPIISKPPVLNVIPNGIRKSNTNSIGHKRR